MICSQTLLIMRVLAILTNFTNFQKILKFGPVRPTTRLPRDSTKEMGIGSGIFILSATDTNCTQNRFKISLLVLKIIFGLLNTLKSLNLLLSRCYFMVVYLKRLNSILENAPKNIFRSLPSIKRKSITFSSCNTAHN